MKKTGTAFIDNIIIHKLYDDNENIITKSGNEAYRENKIQKDVRQRCITRIV